MMRRRFKPTILHEVDDASVAQSKSKVNYLPKAFDSHTTPAMHIIQQLVRGPVSFQDSRPQILLSPNASSSREISNPTNHFHTSPSSSAISPSSSLEES
mmetsp:Transcript_19892/g.54855  ORF Transcript_19892/g.54855 Transcript_19892/m.54855 type:complete len:99 (-) Transcript_19892:345-641(-)